MAARRVCTYMLTLAAAPCLAAWSAAPSAAATVLAAGDIASCSSEDDSKTAALVNGLGGTVLALGDLAYDSGSPAEFANCYNPTWGAFKARTKPVPGNHEYETPGAAGFYGYFSGLPRYYK